MISHYPVKSRQQGVTLLELMITLAIAAILVTLVAPSVQSIVATNRIASQINDTSAAIQFARYSAIDRQTNTVICPSSNYTTCNMSNWNLPKIVFVDSNQNNQRDADEELLHSTQSAVGDILVSGPNEIIGFVDTGASRLPNVSLIKVCPSDGDVKLARGLNINQQGRVKISGDSDNNGVHEDIEGTALTCS
ncbi:GspH/FimT family pseudopilin [Agaribacter marinus]|uniref:Type II secretion system protein H n=1 Tax=Agaribacter marinus TaxID=1431249 RepID=A0AA37T3I6_9ALTE|nr:GspH/FimT family pseudopilin [Agaribacter marinus]GLR73031.1 hypothetical protein GCM10007852_39390 [Agaribacter marinus]